MRIRSHQLLPGLLLSLLSPVGVLAAETGYQLILQAQHANNINETAVDPRSDTTASAIGQFNISQTTSDFFLSGLINAQYNDYLEDTFEDELLLRSVIVADWSWTDSLAWRTRNATNQVRFDQLTPNLPSNRSNQNLFSTGPELIAAFGQANRLTLGANYAINTINDSPNDSDRTTAYAQLRRQLSRPVALSVNYRAQDVVYASAATIPDYRLDETFLRAEWRRGSITFQGDFGMTFTKVEGIEETSDDDLIELLLLYERGDIGVLGARYRNGIGDSTSNLDSPLFDPSVGAGQDLADAGLFREERFELTWIKRIGRVTGNANGFYRDQDFVIIDSDQIVSGVGLNLAFQLNPRWQLGIGGNWENSEFVAANREDELVSASLRVTRSFGERFSVFLEGLYVERESTDPLFVFDDTRTTLGIVFQGGVQPALTQQGRRADGLPPGNIR